MKVIRINNITNALLEQVRNDIFLKTGELFRTKEDIVIYLLNEKGYHHE